MTLNEIFESMYYPEAERIANKIALILENEDVADSLAALTYITAVTCYHAGIKNNQPYLFVVHTFISYLREITANPPRFFH